MTVAIKGDWRAIDRHAKHRKFVSVRNQELNRWALARWSEGAWIETATKQPLDFEPLEYLKP
jgi:hypothetical protein